MLQALNFDSAERILVTRYPIQLYMSSSKCWAKTNVALVTPDRKVFCVIHENKPRDDNDLPESQLIAEAIAAAQFNNDMREQVHGISKKDMVILAIAMLGMVPVFYQVPVSLELLEAVQHGGYPPKTIVKKCIVEAPHIRVKMMTTSSSDRQDAGAVSTRASNAETTTTVESSESLTFLRNVANTLDDAPDFIPTFVLSSSDGREVTCTLVSQGSNISELGMTSGISSLDLRVNMFKSMGASEVDSYISEPTVPDNVAELNASDARPVTSAPIVAPDLQGNVVEPNQPSI
ncbi:hypothetical protein C0995_008844 [Termitomyces sp. Mi166|nr:hypothetical protein C0995_008844 [Termitomyces sp. Mi166\